MAAGHSSFSFKSTFASMASYSKKPYVQRKRAYVAQALILFNAYGTTLSFGPYCEYYYNTNTLGHGGSTQLVSLLQISLGIAAHILALFTAPLPIGSLFMHSKYWKASLVIATVIAIASALLPVWCQHWWQLLLVRVAQGLSLGALATLGILCTATHYRNNIPLASLVGAASAGLGSCVYTVVAYINLQWVVVGAYGDSQRPWAALKKAYYTNSGICAGTLAIAALLLCRNEEWVKGMKTSGPAHSTSTDDIKLPFKKKGTAVFIVGLCLVFFGLFVWPTYSVLILSNAQNHMFPTIPMWQLIFSYAAAALFSALSTTVFARRRLGAVNMIIGASLLAGCAHLNVGYMPFELVAWINNIAFGACLGVIMSLYVRASSSFLMRPWGSKALIKLTGTLALLGVAGASGVVVVAVMIEGGTKEGVQLPLTVSGSCMMAGAALIGVGRWMRSGGKSRVAI
ncbi:MFS general substrate transporter [Lophiostoma macrostomum CBS 122681]|uniref:MFS general substrate transporter n=1 Tax=Lophiostoma macrostomum CBS 122681 TaxID=1314788 RepID=A0A6A6T4H2_9PLEO|nr:MFS general substrate transporter [Lophiostoma macrostomum CBS 122681]